MNTSYWLEFLDQEQKKEYGEHPFYPLLALTGITFERNYLGEFVEPVTKANPYSWRYFSWECKFTVLGGKQYTFPFKMGIGNVYKGINNRWSSRDQLRVKINGNTLDNEHYFKAKPQYRQQILGEYRIGDVLPDVVWQEVGKPVPPMPHEILWSLISDSTCVTGNTFEEFCQEFGYDDDSRTVYKLFQTMLENTNSLRGLLGSHYDEFLKAYDEGLNRWG